MFHTDNSFATGDSNPFYDVYVRDTLLGTTTWVSTNAAGQSLNANAGDGRISDDGTRIVYTTRATNLDVDDTTPDQEAVLWVRDVAAGVIVSRSCTTAQLVGTLCDELGDVFRVDISGDGDTVVFDTTTAADAADTNGVHDVYRNDISTGGPSEVELVSLANDGQGGNSWSIEPAINANGTLVVFSSAATNLTDDSDADGSSDIFGRFATGVTRKFSFDSAGGSTNGTSLSPAVDGSGAIIVFDSFASDLVPGDTNNSKDVFLYDVLAATTELVSVADDGSPFTTPSEVVALSATGRTVLFSGVSGQGPYLLRNTIHDTTDPVGTNATGDTAFVMNAALSGDGRYVAFATPDALQTSDTNGRVDIYVRAYPDPVITSISPTAAPGSTTAVTITGTRFRDVTDLATQYVSSPTISWSNIVVVNDTTITAEVTVAAGVVPGNYLVIAESPDGGPGANSGAAALCGGCLTVD